MSAINRLQKNLSFSEIRRIQCARLRIFIFYGNHSATVQARNTDSELKGLYIRALRVISDLFPHPLFDSLQQTINHRFWHLQLRVVANIIQGK